MPSVSIVMPVRDTTYLRDALSSLLCQSMANFELLIVDDTQDEAAAKRLRTASDDTRIRIIQRGGAQGLAQLLNLGCAQAAGDLIARADGDDVYHKDRLALQCSEMASRPDVVALSCGYHRITPKGKRLWSHRPETDAEQLRVFAMFGAPLLHPGALIRKHAFEKVGGYDSSLWTAQDSDLWVRMSKVGKLGNIVDPLVSWREHESSVIATRGAAGRGLSLEIAERHLTAYLGYAPAGLSDAIQLWRCVSLPRDSITRASICLREIGGVIEKKEPSHVVSGFRKRVARALVIQARRTGITRPRHTLSSVRLAGQWIWGGAA